MQSNQHSLRGYKRNVFPLDIPDEYQFISMYLEDAISIILTVRPENPLHYIYEYFNSILTRKNIQQREFSYIYSTWRNRLSFLAAFEDNFASWNLSQDILVNDFFQLLKLSCIDFPSAIMQSILCVATVQDGTYRSSFQAMTKATKIALFYDEFLNHVKQIYSTCSMIHVTEKSPTDNKEIMDIALSNANNEVGISQKVAQKIEKLIQSNDSKIISLPPISIVECCVFNRGTFEEFTNSFMKNSQLLQHINDIHAALIRSQYPQANQPKELKQLEEDISFTSSIHLIDDKL